MAEENIQSEGAIPPKQSPLTPPAAAPAAGSPIQRKPGEAAASVPPAAAAPSAVSAAAPGTAPEGITIPREQAAKKMTARINLASATGQIPSVTLPPQTDDVKTIKLKPVAPPVMAEAAADSAAVAAQAAKSKTSRISLESALSTQPELSPASPSAAPKTIRLKRPSEMNAPAAAKPALKPPTTHVQIPQPPHQTGQIPAGPAVVAAPPPEAAQEAPDNSPTRKKTIKVKRPGAGGGGGPKITLNKGEGGEAGDKGVGDDNLQSLSSIDSFGPVVAPDKVVFIVAAVVAILVAIDLLWVLAAQLFGPNAAVADFAQMQGPNVPNPPFALAVE